MTSAGSKYRIPSVADTIVLYDLKEMQAEVREDFGMEVATRRLLKQGEISSRFRRKPKQDNSKSS